MVKAEVTVPALKADDRVKIRTECFGKEYAVGRNKYTYGRVVKVNGKIADVQWDNAKGGRGVRMDARLSQLRRVNPIMMMLKRLSMRGEINGCATCLGSRRCIVGVRSKCEWELAQRFR
jgi:hypothetical protein